MIGSTLSHYEIVEEIGKGGMGVVYKARDTHLGRLAAIKILPPERVADADRKRRFIQEARSASALNHPHVITIYDIDSTDQICFIAMEYVDGKTLSQLIPPNGLIPGEALDHAMKIADAVAALHSKGIVHRDLKPTNVMVGKDGILKILDFGLCKLTEPIAGPEASTPSLEVTADGVAVGTPAYMSPEQVEGKRVDARADIFALGVLLYEMLTGRRPFKGETKLAVASAILSQDPVPITSVKGSTPSEIERVVARCLEKDPQRRFQNAADLKVALEWLARDLKSGRLGTSQPAVQDSHRKRRGTLVLTLLLAIAGATAATIFLLRPKPPETPDLQALTTDLGLTTNPALSRDGNLLAYASDRSGDGNLDIWVQQLSGGQPIRRTQTPTDEGNPAFSPDSSSIVFSRMDSGIFLIPALAGEERQVAADGTDPSFSPDGSQIAYWVGDQFRPDSSGRVFLVPLGHGAPTQIAAEFADAKYPRWAPDGKHILFQGARTPGDVPEWWVAPIGPGPAINTGILTNLRNQGLSPMSGPGDWQGNHLMFSAYAQGNRHIWETIIRAPGFRFDGSVRQLTFGAGLEGDPSMASDGRLALASWHFNNNLWSMPLRGDGSGPGHLERLSTTGAFDTNPSISADANRLVFLSRRSGIRQVWIRELDKGGESLLTIGPEEKSTPVISVDGSQAAYSILEDGKPSIYIVPTDSSKPGEVRKACQNCGMPSDWTREGGRILYASGKPLRVNMLDVASGTSSSILQHPSFSLDQAHVSPDGLWIAFVAESGKDRARIFIAPFQTGALVPPKEWIPVTDGTSWDDKPRWFGGDSLIYYSDRDHFGCIWKQQLQVDTMRPAGPPSAVQHFHELRRSPRTLYRADFEIAVARDVLILNLVEAFGNIWLTSIPQR